VGERVSAMLVLQNIAIHTVSSWHALIEVTMYPISRLLALPATATQQPLLRIFIIIFHILMIAVRHLKIYWTDLCQISGLVVAVDYQSKISFPTPQGT